ncbi:AI-2E family transporter [Acidobacteria bacterium AH-259-L09]|nr:AI-2E family transporter [Acidobacteria bacterium AH-259-L09]
MRTFLLISSAFVLYFLFQIFQPFLLPISLAVILVSLCYPVFDWTCKKLKGRRGWAALMTCLWVTASIIVPFVVLVVLLAAEVTEVYQQFKRKLDSGELENLLDLKDNAYLQPLLDRINLDLDNIDLMGSLADALQQVSLFFLSHSTAMLSGLFHIFTGFLGFLIMLVTMFFLFRDGNRLMEELKTWSPFPERYEQLLVNKFQEITSATVLGSLLTALAQGVAGGLVFWIVGISNALFWGFLTALFSLVPVVGTGIVWVPWAIYLFATGSVGWGIFLVVTEVLFVGMIDNFLRPLFIQGKVKMHTLLVFFAIMGGIAYFGMIGMIFGPIIVAVGLTFLELFKIEFRSELAKLIEE